MKETIILEYQSASQNTKENRNTFPFLHRHSEFSKFEIHLTHMHNVYTIMT